MTLGADLYQGAHRRQFDGGRLAKQNCVPTSLADAADQSTRGRISRTGSQVRALVGIREETNPTTPGWSLQDADLAAKRLGVELTPAAGPWSSVVAVRAQGRGVIVQGLSSVFTEGCSASFDGGHCVYLPPLDHSDGRWRLGDPLCPDWRWETPTVLARYAAKLAGPGRALYAYTALIPKSLTLPDTGTDVITTLTLLPFGGTFTIPAGARVEGFQFNPSTGEIGAKKVWEPHVSPSIAHFDAYMTTDATRGDPFLRGTDGYFAGYYIATSAVEEAPNPAPSTDTKHTVQMMVDGKPAGTAIKV